MVFHFRCVTFASMKKRNAFLSLFFGTIVLAALLLQSIHAIHHIDASFKEKKCHHIYAKNKTEITHSHHNFEHCFVCEFTFSHSITADFYSFQYKKSTFLTSYSYSYSKEITPFFKGSLFALRAPPNFIV
jgi:hypothetical protein